MSLYSQLQAAKSEEDVKDAYIKAVALKGYTKGLIDIQSKEIWFEAKDTGKTSSYAMFTQLLHYVQVALDKSEPVPPFLAVIDTEKAAIKSGDIIRTPITPDNLKQVFDKWVEMIGREINGVAKEDYALLFFADIMHDGTVSTHDNLPAELLHKNGALVFSLWEREFSSDQRLVASSSAYAKPSRDGNAPQSLDKSSSHNKLYELGNDDEVRCAKVDSTDMYAKQIDTIAPVGARFIERCFGCGNRPTSK